MLKATHKTSNYLAKLLPPIGRSKYTINCSNQFVNYIKKQKVPASYQMVFFDVTPLFINMPLDEIIDIINLKLINNLHRQKNIDATILQRKMKGLLYLYTKKVALTLRYILKLML